MAITPQTIQAIQTLLDRPDSGTDRFSAVRSVFPELSITRCDYSDMSNEEPYSETSAYALFLVDRTAHCWKLTHDLGAATGLVIASRA